MQFVGPQAWVPGFAALPRPEDDSKGRASFETRALLKCEHARFAPRPEDDKQGGRRGWSAFADHDRWSGARGEPYSHSIVPGGLLVTS